MKETVFTNSNSRSADNLTELVFLLDRSGSMAGLEADTIGGFNSMIQKQKREPRRAPACFMFPGLYRASMSVMSRSTSSSRVAQLVQKRTARWLSSTRAQSEKL